MATEIEYKFLVDAEKWEAIEKTAPQTIIQGFMMKSKEKTIRIRIKNNSGFLTIKGASKGISREEFEYEIPVDDARTLLENYTDKYIQKKRYNIPHNGHTWEVDVFEGPLQGLILAELEVPSETTQFDLPEWVTEDVSHDENYYNAVLIDRC